MRSSGGSGRSGGGGRTPRAGPGTGSGTASGGPAPALWPLLLILALVFTGLAVAMAGPPKWELGTYILAGLAILGTLVVGLDGFRQYSLGQFAAALVGALVLATAAGLVIAAVWRADEDDVTTRTETSGLRDMGPGGAGEVTVRAAPTHGTLLLRLDATNRSPGSSCLPRSTVTFAGTDVTRSRTVEVDGVTEAEVPVRTDASGSGVRVGMTLHAERGCVISFALRKTAYK